MAIDFSFPPEIDALRLKVREFIAEVVRPAEARDRASTRATARFLVKSIIEMRVAAKDWGLWLPHMPKEFGGMGLGHVAMAAVSAEAAKSGFGPYALNAQAPDEGNMHTLLHWATDAQKEKYLRPLCEGLVPLVLRDDGAGGRRLRPDADPDARRPGRRSLGHQRPQVVHLGRQRRQVRHPDRAHRGRPRDPAGREHGLPRRPPVAGLGRRARRHHHGRPPQPRRDPHREPARAEGEHARRPRAGAPARSGAPRAGAAGALHALDRAGRGRARHDGRPRHSSASRTARCWPRSRASSG